MIRLLLCALTLVSSAALAEETPNYYLVTYGPGLSWDASVAFDSQPGMKAHLSYLSRLHDNDIVLMEGPLVDAEGAVMLVRTGSMEQAKRIVEEDPAIINRILTATVQGWRVEMSSMRQFKRVVPDVKGPNEPFKVERIDPNAPITLKQEDSK